jgi:FkbM family methyltransferase
MFAYRASSDMNREHVAHQILLRAWPFRRGAGRLIEKYFSNLKFTEDRVTVLTTDGFPITVMPNDLLGRHVYLTGEFDRTIVEILTDFSEPHDVLLDIGAHIGYVSACFLQNISGSKAICVEPQPKLMDILRANMRQFSQERYRLAPIALSDRDEEGLFDTGRGNTGEGKLVDVFAPNTIVVTVKSADSFISSLTLPRLNLVKIDVEGHEFNILNSSKTHIQRLQPRAILFEDHLQLSAPGGRIGSLLREIGYDVFGIKKRLTKINLMPLMKSSDCVYNDYLAISKTRQISKTAQSKYNLMRTQGRSGVGLA